ncbi:hypothetical protein TVAG_272320 [Trichomonas vaginalis G3]|uniref:Uncharacterized protein n=1 Tax=Trichomonas vaginalis (strain ATCC PRA-98 / G3) TaxID=412133 RepID=A2FDU8_TRIV3|nr:hypothetical protein TVAGG3_0728780 [Trichomonas vaginalis G3]EAX96904.1 hypothetical protein TVAG_272320 [Trichomonas vaginalis G3]KAI5511091.1 hypothetical protein TVAGG3_0728780 [Trichomonas vaginalis G3]|eukprot:XP_001309834.1 hypothetical protein [Trichomonas vaginalis G3]
MIEDHDKENKLELQDVTPEEYKQDEKEENENSPRKMINFMFGTVFSFIVGIYAGLKSREIFECAVYCAMFASEAILCETVSKNVLKYSFKTALHRFALLFTITSLCSIVSGVLKRIFGPKY